MLFSLRDAMDSDKDKEKGQGVISILLQGPEAN